MTIRIFARKSRGADAGLLLEPIRDKNGKFIVSETKFAEDYIFVDTLQDVVEHIRAGYKVRMKSPRGGPPSLISPSSITIESGSEDV
ncbi:hypothetical protein [Maricaulis sp.]|uniref:hypothetical protein n=1 Tax=Maricaulis sp. TaxID=1486257 RepID=UPI002B272C32|nr:hypothetical protein [Maricaulis sp.]